MPRNTQRYRGAAEGRKAAQPSRRAIGRGIHWPRARREAAILVSLAVVVVIAVASLGGALLMMKIDRDWASVASVNGHEVNRETLRARLPVIEFLAQERATFVAQRIQTGDVTQEDAPSLRAQALAPLGDIVGSSRESLIADELLRQLASREGVSTPANVDAWDEATAFITGDFAHMVRYVRFEVPSTPADASPAASDWPAASTANVAAATERVRTELAAGTSIETIVAGLHDAGWKVFGENVAVSADGVPADSSLDMDPSIAAALSRGKIGDIAGPATDLYGRVGMGLLLAPPDTTMLRSQLSAKAAEAEIDTGVLQSWADARALERTLAAALLSRWQSEGVEQAHFRELVVGDAPGSTGSGGPWVELSALALDRLAPLNPSSIEGAPSGLNLGGDALAKTLRELPLPERIALFRSLVAAANAAPASDASRVSGEIGFVTKDELIPEVGKPAFDSKVRSGDVLGPITTSAGPELFLVEALYPGALDERSRVALREVRVDPAPDLVAYTTRFSPADLVLARDAGWRAAPEFGAKEPVRLALFETPVGLLSGPFVLDGKLGLAVVDERRTGVPEGRMLDRLTLDGFDAWFASEMAAATITRADHPLPELEPSPSPTATSALPTALGLETPNIPTMPGLPAATPIKTDEMGLPVLP
jgi:hypothetical protein